MQLRPVPVKVGDGIKELRLFFQVDTGTGLTAEKVHIAFLAYILCMVFLVHRQSYVDTLPTDIQFNQLGYTE